MKSGHKYCLLSTDSLWECKSQIWNNSEKGFLGTDLLEQFFIWEICRIWCLLLLMFHSSNVCCFHGLSFRMFVASNTNRFWRMLLIRCSSLLMFAASNVCGASDASRFWFFSLQMSFAADDCRFLCLLLLMFFTSGACLFFCLLLLMLIVSRFVGFNFCCFLCLSPPTCVSS